MGFKVAYGQEVEEGGKGFSGGVTDREGRGATNFGGSPGFPLSRGVGLGIVELNLVAE
jgi:hypothetical protein